MKVAASIATAVALCAPTQAFVVPSSSFMGAQAARASARSTSQVMTHCFHTHCSISSRAVDALVGVRYGKMSLV